MRFRDERGDPRRRGKAVLLELRRPNRTRRRLLAVRRDVETPLRSLPALCRRVARLVDHYGDRLLPDRPWRSRFFPRRAICRLFLFGGEVVVVLRAPLEHRDVVPPDLTFPLWGAWDSGSSPLIWRFCRYFIKD